MENTGADRVQFANTLRGIASVSVLISHYTGAFWLDNRDSVANLIHAPALPLDKFAFPTYLSWLHTTVPQFSWGAFGVALFFLVSGFVIPFSLRNATWPAFVVGRFFRIVPLYMVGFSVTLAAIWLVGRYFDVPWPFGLRDVAIHYVPGLRDLLWLPSIDGIVWTLEIEVKFYALCALAIVLLRRRSPWVFVVPVVVAVLDLWGSRHMADLALGPPSIYRMSLAFSYSAPFLIFMFIGVAFYYLREKAIHGEAAVLGAAALFLLFATILDAGFLPMLWSYGFAVIVFASAATFPRVFRSTRIGDFFADISYPLYVIHGVAGYAALRVLLDLGAKAWVSLAIVTAGAIALAWLLHITVEIPSHNLGKRLASSLRTRHPPEPVPAE
ncbi:acyltransferase [Mesorhizobium sp. NZP2077]|nr:acyltransferase [Mesorhizobium sp. NZP2077]QKD19964.1 acyltransferase [Mesorhizobium sp. NZP2077]